MWRVDWVGVSVCAHTVLCNRHHWGVFMIAMTMSYFLAFTIIMFLILVMQRIIDGSFRAEDLEVIYSQHIDQSTLAIPIFIKRKISVQVEERY